MTDHQTIEQTFNEYDKDRSTKLERCRVCAALTVPSLFPATGHTESSELPVPYSSFLARGVTNLASKVVNAILPLNGLPFATAEVLPVVQLEGKDDTKLRQILGRIDRGVTRRLESTTLRAALYTAIQHEIVLGECRLYHDDDFNFKVYRIDDYITCRRPDGSIKREIIRDWVDNRHLPDELAGIPKAQTFTSGSGMSRPVSTHHEAMYTDLVHDQESDTWTATKWFRNQRIGEKKVYKVSPYYDMGWSLIAGEDYHRGLIEENIGDCNAVESLSKSLIEGAACNAQIRFLVNPGGTTSLYDLENSSNFDFIAGRTEDVGSLQPRVLIDLQPVVIALDRLIKSMGSMFLMWSAVQPTGDRVTAEAIRESALELDASLGGVFSLQAVSLQPKLYLRTLELMVKDGSIPPEQAKLLYDKRMFTIKVKAGLDVLNREVERNKLIQWAGLIGQSPAAAGANWQAWLTRLTSDFGLDDIGLVKTEEQIMQEQQQAAQANLAMQAGQQVITSAGAIAEKQSV